MTWSYRADWKSCGLKHFDHLSRNQSLSLKFYLVTSRTLRSMHQESYNDFQLNLTWSCMSAMQRHPCAATSILSMRSCSSPPHDVVQSIEITCDMFITLVPCLRQRLMTCRMSGLLMSQRHQWSIRHRSHLSCVNWQRLVNHEISSHEQREQKK